MKKVNIKDTSHLGQAAKEFLSEIGVSRLIAFYGEMGAGKTTFIKAICAELGVEEGVNSPTFTLINEYRLPDNTPVYHFDFYRINKPEEAYDIGTEEFFDSGYLCLMEWPEKIEQILPPETLRVKISVLEDGSRSVTF
jgi:tRNA threonylcarbamoyladenosine biosynthesis protein TsaE